VEDEIGKVATFEDDLGEAAIIEDPIPN